MSSDLVEEFVARALYDQSTGFYETGGRAGRRGASFVTSPEVGPLFGAVVARAVDAWWAEAGHPDRWHVVDAGAGPATLARTIAAAQPACRHALVLTAVEISSTQRAGHPAAVRAGDVEVPVASVAALPRHADVVIANELLDNLPFGLVERTAGGWRPVRVSPDGSTHPDDGGPRVPVMAAAAAWVERARQAAGHVVVFDYADTTAALAARPWTDWVRAFAGHDRLRDPFFGPGSRDITVVVAHDQLPAPTRTSSQADWLRRWDIEDLVAAGQEHWHRHAHAPDVIAMAMRSRATEAEALLDPAGLGAFWVGEWHRRT